MPKRMASRRLLRTLRLPSGCTTLAKARARTRTRAETKARARVKTAETVERTVTPDAQAPWRFLRPLVFEIAAVLRGRTSGLREGRCEPLWAPRTHRVEILEEILIAAETPLMKAEAAAEVP